MIDHQRIFMTVINVMNMFLYHLVFPEQLLLLIFYRLTGVKQ